MKKFRTRCSFWCGKFYFSTNWSQFLTENLNSGWSRWLVLWLTFAVLHCVVHLACIFHCYFHDNHCMFSSMGITFSCGCSFCIWEIQYFHSMYGFSASFFSLPSHLIACPKVTMWLWQMCLEAVVAQILNPKLSRITLSHSLNVSKSDPRVLDNSGVRSHPS